MISSMKVNKENLDRLRMWWTLAFENGNTEVFDKCDKYWYDLLGKDLEVKRFKKFGKVWKDFKLADLVYVCETPLNSNGILEFYYSKDDVIRLCGENKVVGCFIWKKLRGERVEDLFKEWKEKYKEYFLSREDISVYKTEVSMGFFELFVRENNKEVLDVIDVKTGKRRKRE